MNFILSLASLTVLIALNVECQPLADSRNGYINFFTEMLNPSFRQHRGRLRPFASQIGSPVINVRGARDVSKQLNNEKSGKTECLYSFESLYCSNVDKNGAKQSVECDAQEDFKLTDYAKLNKFSIGALRILKTENEMPIAKFYLYGHQNKSQWGDYRLRDMKTNDVNIFSIHLIEDKLADKGLSILNRKCWIEMIQLFTSAQGVEEIQIEKSLTDNAPITKSVKTIANLNIL